MTASTPILAIPYPQGTDRVMDGDNAIQAVAERVEVTLAPVRYIREATKAAAQTFPNGTVDTLCVFDTYVGNAAILSPTVNRLAAPVAGVYRFWMNAYTSANLNAYYRANVRKNAAGAAAGGVELAQAQYLNAGAIPAGYGIQFMTTGLVAMVANDYVETFIKHNFAATVDLIVRMGLEWVAP